DGQLVVGALTTHGELAASGTVREHCPLLAEAAGCVGDLQVRNRGTIGGNLAHADPASDLPAVAVALGATLRLAGPTGSREVAAEDFFLGPLTTALGPDEILTDVRLPTAAALGPGLRVGSAYVKFPHPASGYAVVGVAAVVGLDAQDSCRLVRVGVTGAASRAFRARVVEQALEGRQLGPGADVAAVLEQASSRATDGVEVLEDLFAGREYRAHLCRVYVKRALLQALQRARGA
ncbi:MAG TPA: FAD binding domain-containing protein, partial [Limnochordales bacterium]